MKRPLVIAVLNSDSAISEKLELQGQKNGLEVVIFPDKGRFLEFINFELPEITVYNFAESGLEAYSVLADIKADPWLHYGGIIGLCLPEEEDQIAALLKGTNLVSLIPLREFDRNFPRLLKILMKNRSILFQRHLQKQFLTELSGSFVIDNDPFDLAAYANLIVNFLANADYLDHEGKERLKLTLQELLFNAVEHGNCAISFEEKTAWLNDHKNIFDLIREKNRNPKVRAKKVGFRYTVTPAESTFSIADQGNAGARKADLKHVSLHGRGIALAEIFVKDLRFNPKGNAVSFTFPHAAGGGNTVPGVFAAREKLVFKNNQVVFRENESSDCLYYIVSGRLDVYAEGTKLSSLTPADFFVGEMSFLLANRRSATVKSVGRNFLTAMRTQPHYSIFLARLLAQRLQKLNRKAGRLL
jgi:hypothetical protein